MKRFKKPKAGNVRISNAERTEIMMKVKKKLFPLWLAVFTTAAKDVLKLDAEQVRMIYNRVIQYMDWHEEGLVNIYDFKKSIEKDLGESFEKIVRC